MFAKYRHRKLEKYVQRYFAKHQDIKLVVVVGSGATKITKTMIATLLSQNLRIRMESLNQTGQVETLLSLLGISQPEKYDGSTWREIFRSAKKRCNQPTDTDVVIQAIDMTTPGMAAWLTRLVRAKFCVVTSIESRWIEQFGSREVLATETMQFANSAEYALINRDEVPSENARYVNNPNIGTYGLTASAEYRIEVVDENITQGYQVSVIAPELSKPLSAHIDVVGERSLRAVSAAVAVAMKLGIDTSSIANGLKAIRPVAGNMNRLAGASDTIIIDNTDDAGAHDIEDGLQTLYTAGSPNGLALIGDISGLGAQSAAEHQRVGQLCDPDFLEWVVTIGSETNQYLAAAARARGCQVKSFISPLEAGAFIHEKIHPGATVLAVGSQDNYLEEGIKIFLHATRQDEELVRQTLHWIDLKNDKIAKY